MYLKTGLGFSPARKPASTPLIKSYSFANMSALPSDLTQTRIGGGWYQDDDGYLLFEGNSNAARFGTVYGSARGILVEIAMSAQNLYARPSIDTINEQLTAGISIAAIVSDETDTPTMQLSNGLKVWEFDNSAGGTAVDIEWAGTISTGKASAAAYIKTITGFAPTLSISGNGTEQTGHNVAGYTLHKCEDRTVSGAEALRLSIPAGTTARVACVNFQPHDVETSFIDTAGTALTRNAEDLNGTDASWWSGVQQGTVFLDFTHIDDDAQTSHIFEVRDIALNDRFTIWHTGGQLYTTVRSGGVTVMQRNTITLKNKNRTRIALSYQDNEFIQAINGFTDYIDIVGNAPDTTNFTLAPSPISFLSINRSGAAPLNGIVHSFSLYRTAMNETSLQQLTNPNSSAELWIAFYGDSNLERWESQWGGRPQKRFVDTIQAAFSNSFITNEGKSGSTANYNAAQLLAADWWSGASDSGGGNIHLEALARNHDFTNEQLRNFDYAIINLGANDLRKITTGDITIADYKASFQNVINLIAQDYGPQVKLIMQYLLNSDHLEYTDIAVQNTRDAMRELVAENSAIIAAYEGYDINRVDAVHADEDGYNALSDRAANIILADLRLKPLKSHPQITTAVYEGNTVTLTSNAAALNGSDPSIFRIEDDGVNVSINSALVSGNKVTLTLGTAIASGSLVQLWVGYGQMSALNPALCIRDVTTAYPLSSLSAFNVTPA
jgi:lysophospholipase L1-like esterase